MRDFGELIWLDDAEVRDQFLVRRETDEFERREREEI
jgi:hypothetical protein